MIRVNYTIRHAKQVKVSLAKLSKYAIILSVTVLVKTVTNFEA